MKTEISPTPKAKIAIKFGHSKSSSAAEYNQINEYFNNAEKYFDKPEGFVLGNIYNKPYLLILIRQRCIQ